MTSLHTLVLHNATSMQVGSVIVMIQGKVIVITAQLSCPWTMWSTPTGVATGDQRPDANNFVQVSFQTPWQSSPLTITQPLIRRARNRDLNSYYTW